MESFDLLGSLAGDLHFQFRNLYYVLLPVFFSLSLVFAWFRNPQGSPEFIESIKRAVIGTLLLVGFVEISDCILFVANGIAELFSDMSTLNKFFAMAGEKAATYPHSITSVLFGANDLILATLSFLSYLVVYFARYFMLALYHFGWAFLTILAPLLLLFHVFTTKLTVNLFKSLIEIASWQIVWAVLSAMLKALPFGDAFSVEGAPLILIIMNFIIALCMLGTPLLVHTLVGSGFSGLAGSLGPMTAATMIALPAKAETALTIGRHAINSLRIPDEPSERYRGRGPSQGIFTGVSPLAQEPSLPTAGASSPNTEPSSAPLERRVPDRPEPLPPPSDRSLLGFSEPTR